jgi:hypothetical protein
MAEKPYLSYYGQHGIVPVRQDISDLNRHFARRCALYRHLKIIPIAIKNRTILEFGPGTGDNAVFLASCEPEICVLVDGNPASIQAISEKFQDGLLPRSRFVCKMSDILEYADARRYNFVLCEGVLPGQEAPEMFLTHVASFASTDGIVVITTLSPTSLLAEVCRRVLKPVLSATVSKHDTLLQEITSFFSPDLRSLPGMSRRHEDWVLDNILHPWPARITFSIPEAIATLDHDFDLLGSSPNFIQDWRWYKAIPAHQKTWNDLAREEYARWSPYLLDYRVQPSTPIENLAAELDASCKRALDIHHKIWHHDEIKEIPLFIECLGEIRKVIDKELPETAHSIADFVNGLNQLIAGIKNPDFGTFRSWFGRGQQYVSFTRKETTEN